MDKQLVQKALFDVNYIIQFRYPKPSIRQSLSAEDYYNWAMNLISSESYCRRRSTEMVRKMFLKAAHLANCPNKRRFYYWLKNNTDLLYEERDLFWIERH